MSRNDYEVLRRKNIEDNKRLMRELSLPSLLQVVSTTNSPKRAERTIKHSNEKKELFKGKYSMVTRSSAKLDNSPLSEVCMNLPEDSNSYKKKPLQKENVFGEIPGVAVGTTFITRLECSRLGIHRPSVAGIHGSVTEGCFSLALSGGYEDDVDNGVTFTYTGAGGRDLKGTKANPKNLRTAPQSKDQSLTGPNLALSLNIENGRPVRVVRGYKLQSVFAPEEGYRYDGLYKVDNMWKATGNSGYAVYKYHLRRLDDQDPPPWETE